MVLCGATVLRDGALRSDGLEGTMTLTGPVELLGDEGDIWLKAEAARFLERAACKH